MQTGVLTIGQLTLNETNILQDSADSNGERVIQLVGLETSCEVATISILKDNIMSLLGRLMPVQFQYKNSYNGYYVVTDVKIEYEKWYQGSTVFGWSMSLGIVGPDNAVDIESRLANVVRSNNFSLAGERWHAPAIDHYGYYVGAVSPSLVTRQSETGAITVYRAIPAGVNPRWGSPVGSFLSGRVRYLDNGTERIGVRNLVPTTGWELNNGLVRVRSATQAGTTLFIAVYDGSAWQELPWDVRVGGSSLLPATHFQSATVTRNDPEAVNLRIVGKHPGDGSRVILDLLLRRGSRFVEGYLQRASAGVLAVTPDVAVTTALSPGYFKATGPDANGISIAGGSSKTFVLASTGGVEVTGGTAMDFWIGAEVPKPVSGVGGDPGFESGSTAPWSPSGGTLTVLTGASPKHGTYFGRLTATGGTEARIEMGYDAPAVPLKQYTIAGWLRSPVSLAAGGAMLRMRWYNGLTSLSTSDFAAPALSANVWTPVIGTATAPASTTSVARQAALPGTPAAGAILDMDSLQVREATDSGDTADTLAQQYIGAMAEKTGVARR